MPLDEEAGGCSTPHGKNHEKFPFYCVTTSLISVVTIFVSGSKPGDFTRITSTVTLNGNDEEENKRYKRDTLTSSDDHKFLLDPSPVIPVLKTNEPEVVVNGGKIQNDDQHDDDDFLSSSFLIEPSMNGYMQTDSQSHKYATTSLRLP